MKDDKPQPFHAGDFLEEPAAELAAPLLAHHVTPPADPGLFSRLQAALGDRPVSPWVHGPLVDLDVAAHDGSCDGPTSSGSMS